MMHVMITRERRQARSLKEALEAYQFDISVVPVVELQELSVEDSLLDLASLAGYDGFLFTSANAVRVFYRRWQMHPDLPDFATLQSLGLIASVGKATHQQLQEYSLKADILPSESRAASLLEALLAKTTVEEKRFLFPCSAQARDVLPAGLRKAGAQVDRLHLYHMVPREFDVSDWKRQIQREKVDVITFTSPSIVKAFVGAFSESFLERYSTHFACASIGPTTSRALEEVGLCPQIRATHASVEGLTAAIVDWSLDEGALAHQTERKI